MTDIHGHRKQTKQTTLSFVFALGSFIAIAAIAIVSLIGGSVLAGSPSGSASSGGGSIGTGDAAQPATFTVGPPDETDTVRLCVPGLFIDTLTVKSSNTSDTLFFEKLSSYGNFESTPKPSPVSGILRFTPDSAGRYEFTFGVREKSKTAPFSYTFKKLYIVSFNTPPTIISGDYSYNACQTEEHITHQLKVIDPDGDKISWSMRSGFGIVDSYGRIGFKADTSGTYCFLVRAADECSFVEKKICLTVNLNNLPVFNSFVDTVVLCSSDSICFGVTAYDSDPGDTLTITKASGPGTFRQTGDSTGVNCFWVGAISVPTTYEFWFNLTDDCLRGIASVADTASGVAVKGKVTIVVVPNHRPVVKFKSDTTITSCAEQKICIPVSVTDPDGDFLAVSVANGDYDAVNARVCFTADTAGLYKIILTATDSCGASDIDTARVRFELADDISITCPADTTIRICDPGLVCVPFGPVPAGATVTLIPASASYDPESGNICFPTSCVNCSISKKITVIVANDCSADTCSFTVNVNTGGRPLVIAGPTVESRLCGPGIVCVKVGVSDPDNDVSQIDISPTGVYNIMGGSVCIYADTSGHYSIIITAIDNCGHTSTDTAYADVVVNAAPEVVGADDLALNLCAPQTVCVAFNVSDRDDQSLIVTPSIGSYNKATGLLCLQIDSTGVYRIILTARDNCGLSDADTVVVTATLNAPPVVALGADTTVDLCGLTEICLPLTIPAVPGNYDLATVVASLGSYNPATKQVCFTPSDTGVVGIIVTATDDCGAVDTDTIKITVRLSEPANLVCPEPQDISLCGGGVVEYPLSFSPSYANITASGAGATVANGVLSFTASASGSYTVRVVAATSCGADTCTILFRVTVGEGVTLKCPGDTSIFACEVGELLCFPIGVKADSAGVTVSPIGYYSNGAVRFAVDTAGYYKITVIASTPCGSDTCQFGVRVTLNSPPLISLGPDTTISVCALGQICLPFVVSDPNGGALHVTTSVGYVSGGKICFTPTHAGVHTIIVTASDSCKAKTSDTLLVTIKLNAPPIVVAPESIDTTICANDSICFPVSVADPDGNIKTITVTNGAYHDGLVCFYAGASGRYTVAIRATDSCGASASDSTVIQVTINGRPKVSLDFPADTSLCEPGKICLPVKVSDENIKSIVSNIGAYSAGNICFDADTSGQYLIIVTATDSCDIVDIDSAVVGITVNHRPQVSSAEDHTVFQCALSSICFSVGVVDADGNITSIVVTGAPGVYYLNGQVCFDPDTDGSYAIITTATDSCGTIAADTTVVGVSSNKPPKVDLGPDTLYYDCFVGTELCWPVIISDPDNNLKTITVTGGAYNAATGQMCIVVSGDGAYVVDASVRDSCGLSAKDEVVIVVRGAAPITLECPADDEVEICEIDTLCYEVGGIPDGATVTINGGGWYNYESKTVCVLADCSMRRMLSVIVSNGCYADTCRFKALVTVNSRPVVITPRDTALILCGPQDVCFPVGVSDADNNLLYTQVIPIGYYNKFTGRVCVPIDSAGVYRIFVKAVDSCGAVGVDTVIVNAEENLPPTITGGPDKFVAQCAPTQICLPFSVEDPNNNIIAVYSNVGAYNISSGEVCFTPGDSGGVYRVIVTAVDECGLRSADTTTVTVRVNTAPRFSGRSDTSIFVCSPQKVCLPIRIIDNENNIRGVFPSGGVQWDPVTKTVCFVPARSGSLTFEVTAIDSCGLWATRTYTVNVDMNEPPKVAIAVDTTIGGCVLGQVCLPVGISDANNNVTYVQVLPNGSYNPQTGKACFLPGDTGFVTLIVRVYDACGAVAVDTARVHVTLSPPAQIVCPTEPINISLCAPGMVCQSITVTPPDAIVTVSRGSYANGKLCFEALTAGTVNVIMTASNACGADTCSLSFNVTIGQKPRLDCPTNPVVTLCDPGLACVSIGTLPEGAVVTVSPNGFYEDGKICWTANTSGQYNVKVSASTPCGVDSCAFTATVNINQSPTVVNITDTSVIVCELGNTPICRQATISDPNNNIQSIRVISFASIDAQKKVCFTPDSIGVYTLWVEAIDSCGRAARDSFLVTVIASSIPEIICQDTVRVELCAPGQKCIKINYGPADATLTASYGLVSGDSVCMSIDTSGVYTSRVVASNSCGKDTCNLVVKATIIPPATVRCPQNQNLFRCQPDTICLPFAFTPASAFVSVSAPAYRNGNFICVPIVKDTVMDIRIIAAVSCDADTCSFTVTTALNAPPSVSLGKDTALVVCAIDSICLPVSITDDENNIQNITIDPAIGVYNPQTNKLCILPPSVGQHCVVVTVTDSCGAFHADTVCVTVNLGVFADIVCPTGQQTASLCRPDSVCIIAAVNTGVDSVKTSIGKYNLSSKRICFYADTAGVYTVRLIAYAKCQIDTCQFTVKVTMTLVPTLTCRPAFDTTVCVAQVDSFCFNVGSFSAGTTVTVTPIGKYNSGVLCVPIDTPGVYTINIAASNTCGSANCQLKFTVRDNPAPNLVTPTSLQIERCADEFGEICISGIFATDPNGETVSLSKLCGPGTLQLARPDSGAICFTPTRTDTTYEFCVRAADGCHNRTESFFVTLYPSRACSLCIDLSIVGPDTCTPVGQEVDVHIVANANDPVGGFDVLISYDPSVMAFLYAVAGTAITGKWEYFTYRTGPFGACGGACPPGLLRMVGLADINNGAHHPPTSSLSPHGSIADLRFRIANDQNLGDQFLPINFYWVDCGDNSFSDPTGDNLLVDGRIYNAENGLIWDEFDNVNFPEASRPQGLGAPDDPCLAGDKTLPKRCIDFYNGGVCVVHPDSIDARGDVNLNGLSYEVADAVVFTNYFIHGIRAFRISVEGQTAASDVNADGYTLTVADLVYLVRVIIGDAQPVPKAVPSIETPIVSLEKYGDTYVVRSSATLGIAAAALNFSYSGVAPLSVKLGSSAQELDMVYNVENGAMKALISENPASATGAFIPAGQNEILVITMPVGSDSRLNLLDVEMSDINGWRNMKAQTIDKIIPQEYALSQNYPNPFNPTTTIEVALPKTSDWILSVFNVLGQQIRSYSGRDDAGVVRVNWDGRDNGGRNVASGVYFYTAKAGSFAETRKMVLIK